MLYSHSILQIYISKGRESYFLNLILLKYLTYRIAIAHIFLGEATVFSVKHILFRECLVAITESRNEGISV